jgi:hypothetical protein
VPEPGTGPGVHVPDDDQTALAIIDLLRERGVAALPHAGGRTLLGHLVGSYAIVRRWGQPQWLQHAALIHSIYGTDAYHEQLMSASGAGAVAAVAGDRAERLAWLFSVTPRRPLFAGTYKWMTDLPLRAAGAHDDAIDRPTPTSAELDALVLLHIANLAEQARGSAGRPGTWLVRARDLAEVIADSDAVALPAFLAQLATFSADDESLARQAYLEAVRDLGVGRADGFALAASVCPVVAEPCVWLAYLARVRGDGERSRQWAAQAGSRLAELGTPWDTRLTYVEWLALIEAFDRSHGDEAPLGGPITHPRALFEAVVSDPATGRSGARASRTEPGRISPADAGAGRNRLLRYIEGLGDRDGSRRGVTYPDLGSRPWHRPQDFPLVRYLESNSAAIREEVFALDRARFQRESERIPRTGRWDVAFFYERGRRHGDVCAACPVTSRGIDGHGTVRTATGLIYASRMGASTHIEAHRGPTNVRLRCHLAITVPDGDCAIRVGGETRRWEEGKCLVFDDSFVHEAWNHTESDRVVLIVDLWHPGLSDDEVTLLEALDDHTYRQAERLSRYWSTNAATARSDNGQAPMGPAS